jgi:transcriptional regulator with XRE-family HTH domain
VLNSIFIGDKIKELRKNLKISQEQLAGVNFTKSYISKLEKGIVTPSIKALELISKTLDVPLSTFIDDKKKDDTYLKDFLLAQSLYEQGNYEMSLKNLIEILSAKETIDEDLLTKIYYYISEVSLKVDKYETCIEYCNEAINILTDTENIYGLRILLALGDAYYYINRRLDSLDVFLKAEELLDKHNVFIDVLTRIELYNDIAILYSQLTQKEKSTSYFKRIIDISQNEKIINERVLNAYAGLAQISQIYERDADKSLSYLTKDVLSLYKYFGNYEELSKIYLKFANAYYEKDDLEKFIDYVNKIDDLLPLIKNEEHKTEIKIYYDLYKGKYFLRNGLINDAKELFENAKKLASSNPDFITTMIAVNMNLGMLGIYTNDPQMAIEYYSKGENISYEIEFRLRLPEIYQNLGKAYMMIGDMTKSTEYFDKVYKLLK